MKDIRDWPQNKLESNMFTLIAGLCVLDDEDITMATAKYLRDVTRSLGIPFIFKASFDKANRTSVDSYRGPGIDIGLNTLQLIKDHIGVSITTDIHIPEQAHDVAGVVDIIQIPALLSRQTDLLIAAGNTGLPVNIKKGQFMSPIDIQYAVDKMYNTGNINVMVTERGSMFGYNNIVVDYRGITIMQDYNIPVIFDATHSVQLPGGRGKESFGQTCFVAPLAKAAVAVGVDGLFLEVHPEPSKAKCDGTNSLSLDEVECLLKSLVSIRKVQI